jgi:hypothetical protein
LGDDTRLVTERVGCPGVALADALDLRDMERVDLEPALALVLMTNAAGQGAPME